MQEQRRLPVLWDRVALLALMVLLLFAGVWWLETRFNSLVAVLVLGGIGGAIVFVFGAMFGVRAHKSGIDAASEVHYNTMQVETHRQKVQQQISMLSREYAKAEVAAHKAQLQAHVIDHRKVDQLAQERARAMLTDQQAQPSWEQHIDETGDDEKSAVDTFEW